MKQVLFFTMKIFKIFFVVSTLLISTTARAQKVDISVNVIHALSKYAKLSIYNGSETELVDSVWQSSPGQFEFTLDTDYKQGMYRINVGNNISFNIIISDEAFVDISTVAFAPEDSIKSHFSKENAIFWKYQHKKKQHKQHVWFIQSLMGYYTKNDEFYLSLIDELENQKQNLYTYARRLTEENPNLLTSKFIMLDQRPSASFFENDSKHKNLMDAWWEGVDLNDPRQIHSPYLQSRLWGYFEQLFSDDLDKEQQDETFIEGVNHVMALDMDIEIKRFIRDALIKGFASSDYRPVHEYLLVTKFGELNPKRPSEPFDPSSAKPLVRVGQKAYDFSITLPDGNKKMLSQIDAEYKLVLFWSSWCPYCIESMPRIVDIYQKYKPEGLEVIAVSIDEEEGIWNRYVNELELNWINIREPISRDSQLLYMFEVDETPKMFLLSKELEIISLPSTRRQLEVRLRRLTR